MQDRIEEACGTTKKSKQVEQSLDEHHHISRYSKYPIKVSQWINNNEGDPALSNFIPKLCKHLLHILFPNDMNLNSYDFKRVVYKNDTIYRHGILRVNYTSYDNLRQSDPINPTTHPDVMLSSREGSPYPYEYARVLGIFHADVSYFRTGRLQQEPPKRIEFLWIRRFRAIPTSKGTFACKRFPKLEFLDSQSYEAFGFIDPGQVVRGAHLIPAFGDGEHIDLPSASVAHVLEQNTETEWCAFSNNM